MRFSLVASGACLPLMNLSWSGLIRVGNMHRLMSEFGREIGWKFAGMSGFFSLGRVIGLKLLGKDWLKEWG